MPPLQSRRKGRENLERTEQNTPPVRGKHRKYKQQTPFLCSLKRLLTYLITVIFSLLIIWASQHHVVDKQIRWNAQTLNDVQVAISICIVYWLVFCIPKMSHTMNKTVSVVVHWFETNQYIPALICILKNQPFFFKEASVFWISLGVLRGFECKKCRTSWIKRLSVFAVSCKSAAAAAATTTLPY